VGGNLYSAHFPSDLPPAFLVLGATVTLHGADGPREASLEDLYSKRAETYHKGDIITEVRVPASSGDLTSAFEKTGRTRIDVAILNCAAAVTVRDGSIVNARLALNGVSPAPLLVHEAMEFLAGKPCSVDVFEEAAGIVVRSVSPRGDHRASSAYRKKVAGVIAARVLSRASGVNQ
jgi:CO/xanthine dehydrogenase FAD-binding subunit